jgi:hypothetical protein
VSLFVASSEIEDRDEFEVATGRDTKRPSTLNDIQGVIESCTDILPTSYWLHVELGKISKKLYVKKLNDMLLVFYVVKQLRR